MKTIHEMIDLCSAGPVSTGPSGYQKSYRFASDFIGFQGHFPGNPVLPAIMQIMAAYLAIGQRFGRTPRLLRITRAKFIKIIIPDNLVTVVWDEQQKDEGLLGRFKLMVNDEVASSFFLYLE